MRATASTAAAPTVTTECLNSRPPSRMTSIDGFSTIAVALVEHPSIEVILLGGRLFKHSVVTVGAAAVEAVARIRADLYFMGVTGIHPQAGLSTGDLEESHMKRALLASAAETHVLASAEKIGTASPYVFCQFGEIDGMVAGADISMKTLAEYR